MVKPVQLGLQVRSELQRQKQAQEAFDVQQANAKIDNLSKREQARIDNLTVSAAGLDSF